MNNFYKIMRLGCREGNYGYEALCEVINDLDNHFSKDTFAWGYSAGDIDVYIVPIFYGKYWKRRYEALKSIGFVEITKEDLDPELLFINTHMTF